MDSKATITWIFNRGYAEAALWEGGRPGGERCVVENGEKAGRGDVVELRPAQPRQDRPASLVYLMPVAAFLLGFLLGSDLPARLMDGGILALLAFTAAWIMNRGVRMRRAMRYEVVRILERAPGKT